MNASNIGEKIAERRKELGMTQVELAEKIYVTNKAVSKWENGMNFPDLSLMESIATALDMSVVELLGLEEKTIEEAVRATADISTEEKKRLRKNMRSDIVGTIVLGIIVFVLVTYANANMQAGADISAALRGILILSIGIVAGGVRLAVRYGLSNKAVLSERSVKVIRGVGITMLIVMICLIALMVILAIVIMALFGVFQF